MDESEEPAPKRRNRGHHNSRNGCTQCKVRKVKCDEEKPMCRSCTRRQTQCTYTNDGLDRLASAASVASSPSYDRSQPGSSFTPIQRSYATTPSRPYQNHAAQPSRPSPKTPPPPSPLTLNMAHLELLHHFTIVTSHTITTSSNSHVWHATVPQMALSHEFVMHTVLAISALHIAHLRPEQRLDYRKKAAMHQGRALQLQQLAMADPTQENADALFIFSFLMVYFASASPSLVDGSAVDTPLHAAVQCIHMLRGVRSILPSVRHWVQEGPLAHLLLLYPGHIKSNPTFRDPSTAEHFSKLLIFCSTAPDLNKDTEMEDVESFAAAASSLRAAYLKVESVLEDNQSTPPIWYWAVRLPSSFVQRLNERHVVPLVLIAHWCVLLSQARHYWWVGDWSDKMMGEIEACLPQEYRHWLEWPTEKIRRIVETPRRSD
ncbi:hypothetical protein N7G274_004064 [Stereocaulon virgatum]|uniref:Zn(2)-C6 fungal-type domain-containing protein n=1 Tax=Stereocaulon virgatum TaxID=373712 RepID=A0ABR4ADP1_9LECA